MTAPTPSPTPGPVPTPTTSAVPEPHIGSGNVFLNGGSTSSTSISPVNPDVFDLGKMYNQPLVLGWTYNPVDTSTLQGVESASAGDFVHPDMSTTQKFMGTIHDQWAQQEVERKNKALMDKQGGLTQYEILQKQLWQARFYGQTSFDSVHVGQWTTQTENALKEAFTQYGQDYQSGTPQSFPEFLKANTNQDGGINNKRSSSVLSPAYRVSLTDPSTIRASAISAFQAATGMNPTEAQLSAFVTSFQDQQRQAQLTAETAQHGQVTEYTAPSLGGQAMEYAQQTDPSQYRQFQKQNYVNSLLDMFLPSESQRTAVSPTPSVGGTSSG